jgi:hypothetical protein
MAIEAAKPKVLIPEKVSPDGLNLMQKTLAVDEKKGLSADQLLEIIGTSVLRSSDVARSDANGFCFKATMKPSSSDQRQRSRRACSKRQRNSRSSQEQAWGSIMLMSRLRRSLESLW